MCIFLAPCSVHLAACYYLQDVVIWLQRKAERLRNTAMEGIIMRYEVIINNYQKGAKLKSTPKERIVLMEQIDRNHHRVVYDVESDRQREFIEKVFSRKLRPID